MARIGKPHGIRGEVTVELFTDSPEVRFAQGNVLTLQGHFREHPYTTLTVETTRWHKNILLVKFVECADRTTAETLRNFELYDYIESVADDANSWYADELVGFAVHIDTWDSTAIGEVSNLITRNVQDLLEVRLNDGREFSIPFVEEIVPSISKERDAVLITPPPGLLELNQE
ncbi:ribosome maturation factor RimM [Enteractinococcus fodinae]|uniref:ribosome maturation factor RimM n=1 Tax=Enteractinococcus fodinae TaxID=684663 RepID=UPI00286CD82B|nr:ribosome maturation factor RimM [Enteractinococcus fodinae]